MKKLIALALVLVFSFCLTSAYAKVSTREGDSLLVTSDDSNMVTNYSCYGNKDTLWITVTRGDTLVLSGVYKKYDISVVFYHDFSYTDDEAMDLLMDLADLIYYD